ncbi:MAG: phage holin family protein [Clostridium sp.]|uniref:phage holin family protein n=1 Tax=Clostridium sp. TaxID=1506 RepID=UPI003F4002E6
MEQILNFIPEQLLILIIATYVLGIFLKRIDGVKDKYITIILMVFCIVFSLVLAGVSATGFLQGILCWGAAVGINQTQKQLNRNE